MPAVAEMASGASGVANAGTMKVTVPTLLGSNVLAAEMVTLWSDMVRAGAVHSPPLVIEPAFVLQVTPCGGLYSPLTVADNCTAVPPCATRDDGDTLTLDTDGARAGIVTVTLPYLVPSSVLVALTVIVCTLPDVAGAVNRPDDVIDPPVADHVTLCAGLLVPLTVAENCCWPLPPTLAVLGLTDTLLTVADSAATVAVAAPVLVLSTVLRAVMVMV